MIDGERSRLTPEPRLQLLALLAQDDEPGIAMAYDEFLNWADEDTLAEWVNRKVIMTSPASLRHQLIAQFLGRALAGYAEVVRLGIVVSAPFQMKLERSGREPDVLFLTEAHRDRPHVTYLDGPADLVVEILSPESIGRDRGEKFYEYERAGIPEYWLIDDATQRAEFYQLDERGRYQLVALNAEGVYRSKALSGFWLEVAWLWRDPLPSVEQTLLAIAGERYAQHLLEQLRQQGFTGETDEPTGDSSRAYGMRPRIREACLRRLQAVFHLVDCVGRPRRRPLRRSPRIALSGGFSRQRLLPSRPRRRCPSYHRAPSS